MTQFALISYYYILLFRFCKATTQITCGGALQLNLCLIEAQNLRLPGRIPCYFVSYTKPSLSYHKPNFQLLLLDVRFLTLNKKAGLNSIKKEIYHYIIQIFFEIPITFFYSGYKNSKRGKK